MRYAGMRGLWSKVRGNREGVRVELPTLPDPVLTGVRTVIGRAEGGGWEVKEGRESEGFAGVGREGDVFGRGLERRERGLWCRGIRMAIL